MKKCLLFIGFICFLNLANAQEFADFEITATHQGTGTFSNAVLSDFTWVAAGTINGEVGISDDEIFDDGNELENNFGQADFAENLEIQVYPNGPGTIGTPILSTCTLTLTFDEVTPAEGWGFCVVDIDVENCLISAIDQNDDEVPVEVIDNWLIELFDCNLVEDGINLPKWDPTNAALLGSDTPESYTVYNNLVIGGMPSSEAPAAFFMPDIPLKSLIIDFENLQDMYFTSYHFYIASQLTIGIHSNNVLNMGVYPNPSNGKFTITLPGIRKAGNFSIKLYDSYGTLVKVMDERLTNGNYLEINVCDLPQGIYTCCIFAGDQAMTQKLIIRK